MKTALTSQASCVEQAGLASSMVVAAHLMLRVGWRPSCGPCAARLRLAISAARPRSPQLADVISRALDLQLLSLPP